MAARKVLVFVGSVRDGRHCLKVANMMQKGLVSLGLDASIIGILLMLILANHRFAFIFFFEILLSLNPQWWSNPSTLWKILQQLRNGLRQQSKKIEEASGFVVVSPGDFDLWIRFYNEIKTIFFPEYNATICPALTNLMNFFPPAAYKHKPVSIVTYSMGNGN